MAEAPHKYLHAFIAEATEHLEQLASELVRIEQEPPGGPLWDSIFRRVHSVKGSAATIGLKTIVDIAHVAETLIAKLKAQRRRPERMQVDLLLQATDALVREVQHASGGERAKEDRADTGTLVERLSVASSALPDAAPAPAARPAKKVEADPNLPRLDVTFSLIKACQAPGARALIVQRKLKSAGTLLEMEPQHGSLMQKKGGARVTAVLATARSVDEVRALFDGIPEVEGVAVRPSPPANAPPPEPATTPATPAIQTARNVAISAPTARPPRTCPHTTQPTKQHGTPTRTSFPT